jgi:hypothetical protein
MPGFIRAIENRCEFLRRVHLDSRIDYRLTRRIALRVDYEHQFRPSAPGVDGESGHSLQPQGFGVGFAHRLD